MSGAYPYDHKTRREVANFLPVSTKKLTVLEVGCGYGNFRKNISTECEYWGIEPIQSIANQATESLDKVLVGTFQQVCDSVPDHYFDCVVCNDVIEHMDDFEGFLQEIKVKMNPGGVLVGSIPNVRYIDNLFKLLVLKDWKYVDSGILDKTHLRFFTQKSLQRTFLSNGYEIELFYGINEISIKTESLKRFVLSIGATLFSYLIGWDSRFTQFGFRIKSASK
jgi:2-polyprenyl-3-methyl-5-hydroxy-6-metoxy-1,4-benzoquinol methylase